MITVDRPETGPSPAAAPHRDAVARAQRSSSGTDVIEVESADAWAEVVSKCFVPLRTLAREAQFRGRMEYARLDASVAISKVTTSGTIADRTGRLAASAPGDDLHVSLQGTARGHVSQNGHLVQVAPGSVSTYATYLPYHLDYSAPNQQQTIIQISQRSLGLPRRMVEAARDRILTPPTTAADVLFEVVDALRVSADPTGETAVTLRDLAATMIRSSFAGTPVTPRTDPALRATVESFARRTFRDPELDASALAAVHAISRRKLYQLFEPSGTTPAALLRGIRLQAAAEALVSEPSRPIGEIAFACGFADATTFTRAFRRDRGCTPAESRAAARRNAA